jgi:hypothetical protein
MGSLEVIRVNEDHQGGTRRERARTAINRYDPNTKLNPFSFSGVSRSMFSN